VNFEGRTGQIAAPATPVTFVIFPRRACASGAGKTSRKHGAGEENLGREELPAVAAVPTITAITTSAAATTTAFSAIAAASASTATIVSAATSAAGAFGLRACFIDYEIPATKILTVQTVDRAIRIFIAVDFDEGETS
jgi:hypothetical protein